MNLPSAMRVLLAEPGLPDPLLPDELAAVYGAFSPPAQAPDGVSVVANFVETLDGVVSLGAPNLAGGEAISGGNVHDRFVMGLLRACADAVVVGASTILVGAGSPLTPWRMFPAYREAFERWRHASGRPGPPLNVVVSASGTVDLTRRMFWQPEGDVLIVTSEAGEQRLRSVAVPGHVTVRSAAAGNPEVLTAASIIDAIQAERPMRRVLLEAGPKMVGTFLAEHALDELFVTLSPQVAGRLPGSGRRTMIEGVELAPDNPAWADLVSARLAGSHLFLRYRFPANRAG